MLKLPMNNSFSQFLFNTIAPLYNLFYVYQKKSFLKTLQKESVQAQLKGVTKICDIGSGTGAFASVLCDLGYEVTGVDFASNMVKQSNNNTKHQSIQFIQGDILKGLPFSDHSFDLVIASHVAHGMKQSERFKMYAEMKRISKSKIILHDYNSKRHILISMIEGLEQGDYFNFILQVPQELKELFESVVEIPIDTYASWYVCTSK